MKEKITKYIVDNIHAVILTDAFANLLKNHELSLEVLRNFAVNKCGTILKNSYTSICNSSTN